MMGLCCLLMAMCGVRSARAQQDAAPRLIAAPTAAARPAVKPVNAEEEDSPKPDTSGSQGIKVHGHWVLQVKNADGTLGERREFNNSLVTNGAALSGDLVLGSLLFGDSSSGGLAIAFISGPTTTPGLDASTFCDAVGYPAPPANISCYGFYPAGSLFDGSSLRTLVNPGQTGLTSVLNLTPALSIVLSGNYIVPSALGSLGTINAVQTYTSLCTSSSPSVGLNTSDVAPNACLGSLNLGTAHANLFAGALTSTNIPNGPMPVTTGQVISVTVTITFS